MSSGTSSASPGDLNVFLTEGGAATGRLEAAINLAAGAVNDFFHAPCDARFRPAGSENAFNQAQQLHTANTTDERWLDGIRNAFVAADSNTLPNGAIAQSLNAAGISATAPSALTADEPVYQGATMYSGWSDDPVSTGAGHFLEVDEDLVMAPALAALAWTRTYSSRFLRDGACGRGWYSWADVRLEIGESEVLYHGPDGQIASFVPRRGAGIPETADPTGEVAGSIRTFVAHPAMEGELNGGDVGYRLRWRWASRFPGAVWCFDGDGRLRRIEDPFGATTVVDHDSDDRICTLTHQGGRRLDLRWVDGHVAEVTSNDGRSVRYRYEDSFLVAVEGAGQARHYAADTEGRIADMFDADGVRLARNTYDDDGRVLSQKSPFGRVARYRYVAPFTVIVGDDDGGPTNLYRHDGAGRLVELRMGGGERMTRVFDDRGNPVEVVGIDGGTTRRVFDTAGNCVEEVDPDGGISRSSYDHNGRLLSHTDAAGTTRSYRYEGANALPSTVEGPFGVECLLEIVDGQTMAIEDADGIRVELERNSDGLIVASTTAGATTRYRYAADGSVVEIIQPDGETELLEVDDAGRLMGWVNAAGDRWAWTRTSAGRVVASRDFTGATVNARYGTHGELVSVIDPAGVETTTEWDAMGNATALATPTGPWHFRYDELSRWQATIDPTGARWEANWSPQGFFAGTTDPLGHKPTSTFNHRGRQTRAVTAGGTVMNLSWDGSGRFTGGTSPDRTSCELRRDAAGRPVTWVVNGEVQSSCTYTPAGRLASVSRSDGAEWRWRYDGGGTASGGAGPGRRRKDRVRHVGAGGARDRRRRLDHGDHVGPRRPPGNHHER